MYAPSSHVVSGWSPHSGIWARIHAKAADIGYDSIQIHKVKAHLTVSSPAQAAWLTMGNDHADRFAKLGARRHPVDGAAMERLSRSRIVVEHIGKYIGFVMSRVLPRLSETPRPPRDSS